MAEDPAMPGLFCAHKPHRGDAGMCLKKVPGYLRGSQGKACYLTIASTLQLMKCVRLPLLSRDFLLGHVDAESLVRHHPDCKDLLIEALKFHLLPEQRGVLGTSRTRPRRCEGAGPVLFAVGMPTCPVPQALPHVPTHEPSTSPTPQPCASSILHSPHICSSIPHGVTHSPVPTPLALGASRPSISRCDRAF